MAEQNELSIFNHDKMEQTGLYVDRYKQQWIEESM